ncbi:MAG: hypothetical protein ABIX01_14510 [Chitinophagaceae bacterium]
MKQKNAEKEVRIADITGKIIFSNKIQVTDAKIQVHLGTAPVPGVYTIQVEGLESKMLFFK